MNDYAPLDDVEAPISFTGKIGGNLMTIRGNDTDQFLERLDDFIEKGAIAKVAEFNELTNAASNVAAGFSQSGAGSQGARRSSGSSSPRSGGSPRGGSQRRESAPQRQSAPADDVEYHPDGLTCDKPGCGKDIFLKTGTSRAGRQFEVWTCPDQASKNDGHFSQYVS